MITYNFTEEDIKFVEKAIELKNKGFFIDGTQLATVYNRVLNKHVNPTNCGSCCRQRVNELEGALTVYRLQNDEECKKSMQEVKIEVEGEIKKKINDTLKDEEMKARMARVRSMKKNKK